jgi:hypothetical protein
MNQPNIYQAPVPIFSVDLEDFKEQGMHNPSATEVNEVVNYLRAFYLYNGDLNEQIKTAVLSVKAKRDLF